MKLSLSILLAFGSFIGFSVAVADWDESSSRLMESCVLGNLPMELQFKLPGNPSFLGGDVLDSKNVRTLYEQLDGRVLNLIIESIEKTNNKLNVDGPFPESIDDQYINELIVELAYIASSAFDVEYCGNENEVPSFLLAILFEYLSRATMNAHGNVPSWLQVYPVSVQNERVIVTMLVIYSEYKNLTNYRELLSSFK